MGRRREPHTGRAGERRVPLPVGGTVAGRRAGTPVTPRCPGVRSYPQGQGGLLVGRALVGRALVGSARGAAEREPLFEPARSRQRPARAATHLLPTPTALPHLEPRRVVAPSPKDTAATHLGPHPDAPGCPAAGTSSSAASLVSATTTHQPWSSVRCRGWLSRGGAGTHRGVSASVCTEIAGQAGFAARLTLVRPVHAVVPAAAPGGKPLLPQLRWDAPEDCPSSAAVNDRIEHWMESIASRCSAGRNADGRCWRDELDEPRRRRGCRYAGRC